MKKPAICFLFSSRLMQSARPRSSPEDTRITTFLIVQCSYCHIWVFASFQFHCSVLTIFLVDGLEIKMVAGRCRATAGRRQKMRWRAATLRRPWNLSSPFWMSRHHLDFVVSDFSLLCLTLGIFRTLGGRIWVFKNGNHYCWAERIVVWSSSEPPHKSYMVYTSSWFSGFDGKSRLNQWLGQLGC